MTNLIEMELVTREVVLIRAALRLHAGEASGDAARTCEQLASHMHPIGLYQFKPMEAALACLALREYADISEQVGHSRIAALARDVSDEFLRACFLIRPTDEATHLLRQVEEMRKEGITRESRAIGFIPRIAAAIGFAGSARDQVRPL